MSKYQSLSDHLAARSDQEWRPSFSELEAVLGFPLPKAARTGRAWWGNDPEKVHSRAWTAQGWEVGDVDHAARQVVFRRGAASAAALEPPTPRAPEELAALAAERPDEELEPARPAKAPGGGTARALGTTALVTAGLAVVAGLGAVLLRVRMRRR